jgi:predicted nuclease of predicted toxin-antitoxin system
MKIFVDENIPAMTVSELRALGHDVMDIRGTKYEGITDEHIWEMVQKDKRLLITTDKGFVQNRHEKHNGILIIRLKQPNRKKIHQKILKAMSFFKEPAWIGSTIVMKDTFHSIWKAKSKK